MTEDQIERRVEHMVNVADARLMRGRLAQAEYDAEMKRIHAWAEAQYQKAKQS
jgi:hypothetical protein